MSFPKWVSRGHGIGDVLCVNAEEEASICAERAEREGPAKETPAPPPEPTSAPAPAPVIERKKPGRKPKAQ